MNDLNPIVKKLIESHAISMDEWNVLLNEWDESNRIEWTKFYDENDCLLSLWCKKNIPIDVVERLSDKYGKEIWAHSHHNGTIFDVLVRRASDKTREDFDNYFKVLLNIFSPQELWGSAQKNTDIQRRWFYNAPTSFAMAMFSLDRDAQGLLRHLLHTDPSLITSEYKGKYIADILTSQASTFKQYTDAGGSLFFEINGKPLWQYLMHKKIYHTQLKNALESGLTRMLEESAPQENDVKFSKEDWVKLEQQKTLILQERTVFEFEQDLKKDWRSALKSNKDWRKWVNPEGANVMHWLALNQGEVFVHSAVNKKVNESLIMSQDAKNNDTLIYFLLGTTNIFKNMTSRRSAKFVREHFPEFWDKYLPLCVSSPKKGVLPTFVEAQSDDFFKSTAELPNSSYADDIRNSLFKALPNTDIMLNGMTTDHWLTLHTSPNKFERCKEFLEAYWAYHIPETQWNTILSNDDKILFVRLMLSNSFYQNLSSEKKQTFNHLISDVASYGPDDYTLALSTLQQLSKNPRSYLPYQNNEYNIKLQTWLDKQVLVKSIETPDLIEDTTTRKRRM